MNELKELSGEYKLILTNRRNLYIEGVEHVANFSQEEIILETKLGLLILKGEELDITQLNLEDGNFKVEGLFKSVEFSNDHVNKGLKNRSKGMLERLLK